MGTGSHRPQWETAKGRPDITGGIKHARALKSHTQLKFRDPTKIKASPRAIESSPSFEPAPADPKLQSKVKPESMSQQQQQQRQQQQSTCENSENDSEDASEEDEDELKRELMLLDKREKLKKQLATPQKSNNASSWRTESAFKRKPRNQDKNFLDKVVKWFYWFIFQWMFYLFTNFIYLFIQCVLDTCSCTTFTSYI